MTTQGARVDGTNGEQRATPAHHLAILASAGSGKTFQLTNRMLHLLLRGERPDAIFASTFTRMAAGEIRDRVVQRLVAAASSDDGMARLAEELNASGLTLPSTDRERAVAVLREIARRPHRLGVRTLDSFFAGIVRGYAVELGLPTDMEFAAEEELEDIRQRALERLLNENDPERLITWLRAISEGASESPVLKLLDDKVAKLLGLWRQTADEHWRVLEMRPMLSQSELAAAIVRLESLTADDLGPDKRFGNAHANYIGAARERDWELWLSKGIANAIIEKDGVYYSKPIPPAVIDAYTPVIEHARAAIVNQLRLRIEATLELLARLDRAERNLKRDESLLTFDDLTRSLLEAQLTGEFDHICFRLDQKLEHLLLDEFQDTSAEQHRVLEPMINEVTAHGDGSRSFFCVGDVKQSIYGWRGGDPELLASLARDEHRAVEERTLDKSWRSSPVIMEAVNRVFESKFAGLTFERKSAGGSTLFAELFNTHTTAKRDLPGYAELSMFDCDEADLNGRSNVRLEAMARLTIDRVADLHERAPHLHIGVLTRSNKAVAHLLYECSAARRNLPASGRGGGSLTDAPAVNAVLDAIRMADHPDDTVAAFHAARSPLGPVLDFTDEGGAKLRHAVAARIRRRLLSDGYANTIQRWAEGIAPHCDPRELSRLHALIERAAAFDERATLRPADFVKRMEAADIRHAERAPIEIMNVHQSKGLEFDVVILPQLDAKLCGNDAPAAYEREGLAGPIVRAAPWVNQETRALAPELEPLFDQHHDRATRESLCVLYVAMTRAKLGLIMLIDRPPKSHLKSGEIVHANHLLAATLAPDVDLREAEWGSTLYRDGDLDAVLAHRRPDDAAIDDAAGDVAATAEVAALELTPHLAQSNSADGDGSHRRLLRLRGGAARPASMTMNDGDHAAALDRLRLLNDDAIDRGTAVHALFEGVTWLGEAGSADAMEDDVLLERLAVLAPRRSGDWRFQTLLAFRTALAGTEVRDALAPPRLDPGHTLHVAHELPYARAIDGRIQRGYIDRLVIERDSSGRAIRAEVIDYKTDAIDDDDRAVRAQAEHHRPQLEAYRAVVSALHQLPRDDIEMKLVFVRPGRVVTLEPSPSPPAPA